MDITDWDNNEILHLVMAKGHITQKSLLKTFTDKNGKSISQSTFSSKIQRNSLKIAELQQICKILGYTIHINKDEK